MEVPTKQFLVCMVLSCAQVGPAFRMQMQSSGSSVGSTPKEPDTTNLLQSKVAVQAAIDTESSQNVRASESTQYVPGTPGAPWSEAEMLAVKAKLWYVLGLTRGETEELYASLHPGFKNSQHEFRGQYMGRMAPAWNRLGFHGCLPDEDQMGGHGGCDGCLYWDGLGHVYMDYFASSAIPIYKGHNKAPNFNNGLGPAVEILEKIYKNGSWPEKTPILEKSLFASGKSRADLWAFAGSNAVEFGVFLNNMICTTPRFELDGVNKVYYPDSIESNSWFAEHCSQFQGTPNCTVDLGKGFEFKTGRKDCLPMKLYKKTDHLACLPTLEIKTASECEAATAELGLDKAMVQFEDEGGYPVCKYGEVAHGTSQALCYKSLDDEYNGGNWSYYMQMPIVDYGKTCRDDLMVMTEEECRQAAVNVRLPFGEERLGIQGCYIVDFTEPHWVLNWAVHYGEGETPPKDSSLKEYYPTWGTGYGKILKSVCREEPEPLRPYMASTWGGGPNHQMNGDMTVQYFNEAFEMVNWKPRDTVAILGAHTQGRFHAIDDIFRYVWIRNGGMVFNNAYYRNMAGRPDWSFRDNGCKKVGTAYGQKGPTRWTAFRRYEQENRGPTSWVLERYVCIDDCHANGQIAENNNPCCQDIPEGGHCKPDNNRGNITDPVEMVAADDNMWLGCERWYTETGQHESATPAEMGLYYKFKLKENDEPSDEGCPGLAPEFTDRFPTPWAVGCPLNDASIGEENEMKLHELVELYADDQQAWIRDFVLAWDKMVQNGYKAGELVEGPLHHKKVICPTQESVLWPTLRYWTCFSTDDLDNHLSEPFLLYSHLDGHFLELDPVIGNFRLSPDAKDPKQHQLWYTATTPNGQVLVNGLKQWGVGNLTYDSEHHLLLGGGGVVMRDPNTVSNAKLVFAKDKHMSWMSAGWGAIGLNDDLPQTKLPKCLVLKTVHRSYVSVASSGALSARSGTPTPSEEFQVTFNSDETISLKASNGKFVAAEPGGQLNAVSDKPEGPAKLTFVRNLDGTISLKTADQHYWASQAVGSVEAKNSCERFTKHSNPDGTVAYQSAWGLYIVEQWDGHLNADRSWAGPWNHFKVEQNSDSTISFLTDRGYYVKAKGSGILDAFEEKIGPQHKFEEITNSDGTVSLKQASGDLLVATGDGKLFDRKEMSAGAWENFVPALCDLKDIVGTDCSLSCYSPLCVSGNPANGGVMLNTNVCENTCSVAYSGIRYCGTGPSYEGEFSVDCSGCADS